MPCRKGLSWTASKRVDQLGVRIGVAVNSAYDLFLGRALRHAETRPVCERRSRRGGRSTPAASMRSQG